MLPSEFLKLLMCSGLRLQGDTCGGWRHGGSHSAILTVVDECRQAKHFAAQNLKESERLMDALEAVEPPLRAFEKANPVPIAREVTLCKLKANVDGAHALLLRHRQRNRFFHVRNREVVRQEFDGIILALESMAGLNLSMGVRSEESAETEDATACDNVADEMEAGLKELTGRVGGLLEYSDFFTGTKENV